MSIVYCLLALSIAFSLSHANRGVRAMGTLLVALCLTMIVASIVLANFDGTFTRFAVETAGLEHFKPLMLNIGAAVGAIVSVFLVWAAWRQTRRSRVVPLLFANTKSTFGFISRYAHWITATLILCLIPMGMFMSLLPPRSADRATYQFAHESLGFVVLGVAAVRLGWLVLSPPPGVLAGLRRWEARAAHAVHIGLYALIIAFPVSGLMLEASRGDKPNLWGWALPRMPMVLLSFHDWALVHDWVAPCLMLAVLCLHIGAVVKHHFFGPNREGMPRMLR